MSIEVRGRSSLSRRIAAEIRAEMARQRMSGRQLAGRVGRSPNWVSLKTSGEHRLDLDDLELIAPALGITPLDLVQRAHPTPREYSAAVLLRPIGPSAPPASGRPPGRPGVAHPRPGPHRTAMARP